MTTGSSDPEPFNPADEGTPEQEWLRLLSGAQEWRPGQGPLIVVAPHPDDEVLGAGGLIQCWAAAGQPVTVVSVTDGEAANTSWRGLDLVRRKELQNALRILAPRHITIKRASIPDGKVREHANRLRQIIEQHATPGATLVGPYEHDGHPDHDVAGQICGEVAAAAGVSLARYLVWTWHHTQPTAVQSLRWVRFSLTCAAQRAKARAMQCFASQVQPPAGDPIVPPHVLAHFRRPYEAFLV